MRRDTTNWTERMFGGYRDFVIDMVHAGALGAYFTAHGCDLNDMERHARFVREFRLADLRDLAEGESLTITPPDPYFYEKFKGAAAAIMLASHAHEKKLISFNTFNAIVYNEGQTSNYGHLCDAVRGLVFGRDTSLSPDETSALHDVCTAFVEECQQAARTQDSVLSKALAEAQRSNTRNHR